MNKTSLLNIVGAVSLLSACAATTPVATSSAAPASAPAPAPAQGLLAAPKKTILVLESDTSQKYEILGDVQATLSGQGVYNIGSSQDQAREHLKRTAYAQYGERLDAIVNYREATTIGGGNYFGAVGAAFGAKNTSIQAKGVAVRFTGRK